VGPQSHLKVVLMWGITDRYTWLNGQEEDKRAYGKPLPPLPFDQKPAADSGLLCGLCGARRDR
jgi:GH35 family endo-1,4-beta-xylanase